MILFMVMVGGCAVRSAPVACAVEAEGRIAEGESAGALVFSPPLTAGQPALVLARWPRQAGAFLGYEESVTTFSYIRTYDRQASDWTDRYHRTAVIERVGVSYR